MNRIVEVDESHVEITEEMKAAGVLAADLISYEWGSTPEGTLVTSLFSLLLPVIYIHSLDILFLIQDGDQPSIFALFDPLPADLLVACIIMPRCYHPLNAPTSPHGTVTPARIHRH